jgi:hypothetical protein
MTMRLPRLDRAHSWYARAFFALVRRMSGRKPPDIMKSLYYRPGYFGLRFSELTHEVMRGDSPWTVGERELFAAYTSSLNQCVF